MPVAFRRTLVSLRRGSDDPAVVRSEAPPNRSRLVLIAFALPALGPGLDHLVVGIAGAEPAPAFEEGLAVLEAERVGLDRAIVEEELQHRNPLR